MTEAYQKMFYECDYPVCRVNNLGDEIQGLNYDTWKEQHPEFLETHELMEKLDKIKPEKIKKLVKLNSIRTGVILPPDQVNLYVSIQNLDFYKKVMNNAKNLNMTGTAINFTEGNHSANTEGYLLSSREIAKELCYKLGVDSRSISAEIFGDEGFKEGTFGINPYLYAEYNRHVSRGSKTGSYAATLLNARMKRGRTFADMENRVLISRFGHLHSGMEAYGNNNLIISCYCGQERTSFSEVRDYPYVVNGVKVVGFPEGGPGTGPFIFIDFFIDNIQEYFKSKKAPGKDVFE
jgi:hypothetical protein